MTYLHVLHLLQDCLTLLELLLGEIAPLGWVNLAASAALFTHAICVLNRMTWHTSHLLRVSYIVLALGAAAVFLAPLYGYLHPELSEVLTNVGAALVLIIGRWLRHGGFKRQGYLELPTHSHHRRLP